MRGVGFRAVVVTTVVVAVAGCTSGSGDEPSRERTVTSTQTRTSTVPSGSFTAEPDKNVKALPPGKAVPDGEKKGRCPYIRSGLNEDPTSKPNVADIEGNRVGRTTVLTGFSPVGCRFYYANPDYHAVADIRPRTFANATEAHNALVLTARAGRAARSYPDFVPGVDGINYRTNLYKPDRGRDWAFAFAKGNVLVVVRTDQDDVPINALYLARAIAGKF